MTKLPRRGVTCNIVRKHHLGKKFNKEENLRFSLYTDHTPKKKRAAEVDDDHVC